MDSEKVPAIVLAAGASTRMGQSKQMLDIHGKKLLRKTVETILDAGISKVAVILGAKEKEHREILKDLSIDIIYHAAWEKGMGSSIKVGLKYLVSDNPSVDAVVVSVCDQPLLHSGIIHNLISAYRETDKPIIASGYSAVPGVPVLFDKRYFQDLEKLPDDAGAKKFILENMSDVFVSPFPGGEIDLDTMRDYEAFKGGSSGLGH